MNLKVVQSTKLAEAKAIVGVGWYNGTDYFAVTEDKVVQRISLNNSLQSETDPKTVCELPSYPICMQWCHTQYGMNPDVMAVGLSDGSLCLLNANGVIENTIPNAHNGAITSISWCLDGSAFATGGEDGLVKLWSPQGHLRSKIAQLSAPVLSLTWDGTSQYIICAHNNELLKKCVGPEGKDIAFVGHTGIVLCVAYCPVLNLFLSGAEDNTYRLWDNFGRCVYRSEALDLPVSSCTFAPSGQSFAIGTYDCVLLCDAKGWVSDRLLLSPNLTSRAGLGMGSIYCISYTPDGSAIVLGGASGSVATAIIFNIRSEWEGWVSYSGASNNVYVGQIGKDEEDQVEVGGRITHSTLGYEHLLVCTPTALSIYPLQSLSTPVTLDATLPSTIKMSSNHFAFVDNTLGIRVYTYQGKLLCSVRFPGFRAELLTTKHFDVASDVLVVAPSSLPGKILLFDIMSEKQIGAYTHNIPVSMVSLSSEMDSSERTIAFLDQSHDLYILQASKIEDSSKNLNSDIPVVCEPVKVLSQVETSMFHKSHTTLVALADGKLHLLWCPSAFFTDRGIAGKTITKLDLPLAIGQDAALLSSFGNRVEILAANGTYHTTAISPLPSSLAKLCRTQQWRNAMSLCRSKGDDECLWGILASLAVAHQQIDIAELSFAQLLEVDKVEYMQYIRSLPSAQARAAELLLYCKRPDDAQRLLLQAGLTYRAIKLCIRTFRWERALQLALQLRQHIDLVLYHRQLFLTNVHQKEHLDAFIQAASQVVVNPQEVKRKEEEEDRADIANASLYTGHFLNHVVHK